MADAELFEAAVAALDSGDLGALATLLADHPELVRDRWVAHSDDAYFADPYLLWFVANNPIRDERMAPDIVELTQVIIEVAEEHAVESLQQQLDYTVALVASGRVPRDAGVQLDLIDALVEAGADPNALEPALAHRETAAAVRLVERGAALTLLAAVCLDRRDDVARLVVDATADELFIALAGAAIYGNTWALRELIDHGASPNGFCPDGFHAHSTPLHQAVFSGSLDAVRVLVDAGRRPLRPRPARSTARRSAGPTTASNAEIAAYLRSVAAP